MISYCSLRFALEGIRPYGHKAGWTASNSWTKWWSPPSRTRKSSLRRKLDKLTLQSLNSFSVADAIRYFSGIQIKDYGGIGGLKTVNIRSLGTHHVGIFYDGIQLGNAQNGQVDLGKFSLENMEEISLYNGQKSEIFPTGQGLRFFRLGVPAFAHATIRRGKEV